MKMRSIVPVLFLGLVFGAGCAMGPPANTSGAPRGGYQPPQEGASAPRGGYQQQMNQEQSQRNREAAGNLLPELLKMRDQMVK